MAAHRSVTLTSFLASTAILLISTTAWAAPVNSIANPGFEIPNLSYAAPNFATSQSGAGVGSASSAANWSLYNNSAPTTNNELLTPSTDPFLPGGIYMTHASSAGNFDGLYQVFAPITGFAAEVDVFVVSGTIFFGLYTGGGNTLVASTSSSAPGWQRLAIPLQPLLTTNEVVLYTTAGGGNFYADNVWVSSAPLLGGIAPAPEPSTYALLLGGLGLAGFMTRRRKNNGRATA